MKAAVPLHVCQRSGYVVGPDHALAADAVEFHQGEEQIVAGCTRLYCLSCKHPVQIEPDPLPADRSARRYACHCQSYDATGVRSPDYDDEYEGMLPWACAGHPIATLPLVLDGESVATGSDAAGLMRRTLGGWCPEAARLGERISAVGWAIKLYVRLLDTGLEHAVSQTAAACIADPDARVRAAALWFLAAYPESKGAECVDDVAAGDRSLFVDVVDPLDRGSTLEVRLLRALGRRLLARDAQGRVKAQRALELARVDVLRSKVGKVLLPFLHEVDAKWLERHGL